MNSKCKINTPKKFRHLDFSENSPWKNAIRGKTSEREILLFLQDTGKINYNKKTNLSMFLNNNMP